MCLCNCARYHVFMHIICGTLVRKQKIKALILAIGRITPQCVTVMKQEIQSRFSSSPIAFPDLALSTLSYLSLILQGLLKGMDKLSQNLFSNLVIQNFFLVVGYENIVTPWLLASGLREMYLYHKMKHENIIRNIQILNWLEKQHSQICKADFESTRDLQLR